MKLSTGVLWLALALVLVAALLALDPLVWFHGPTGLEPVEDATQDAPDAIEAPGSEEARPSPAAESQREAAIPLAAPATTTLRLLDAADEPVEDAQLILLRGQELLADERTDAAGEMGVAADGKPALLVVAIPDRPLEWHDLVLGPGRQEIRLAAGASLSGRFVGEDGASPGRLRISLWSDHPWAGPAGGGELPDLDEAVRAGTLRKPYAVFETDESGAFSLTGLPESWSGRIRVGGGWKVLSTTHGELSPGSSGVSFTWPCADIVVSVRPRRTLQGRLLFANDGSPLSHVQLSTSIRSPDTSSPDFPTATTDQDGRFEVTSRQERIDEFELRLGSRFHEAVPLLELGAAELPASGDLGDFIVDQVRHVPFLLQDTAGLPIEGGMARAAGIISKATGQDGRGELRWLSATVNRLVAEAPGFVPAEQTIPAVVAQPLIVTMEMASELVVRLRLPEGGDPSQFRVLLFADEPITAGPVATMSDQRRHVRSWGRPPVPFLAAQKPMDSYLAARPEEATGISTFLALRPGVELSLEVHGLTGETIYYSQSVAPIGIAERREIEISLESELIVFRGRVLDQKGHPLARAVVQLGGQILGFAIESGEFECFLAEPQTGTLLVQHQSCTTLLLHDYVVPIDGKPVEFRLKPAHPLTIEVVDESGAPLPQAEVFYLHDEFIANTHRLEANRFRIAAMPDGPFDIRVTLAGHTFLHRHYPPTTEARVVLPVPGRVVGLVDATTTAGRTGQFSLFLLPLGDDSATPVVQVRDSAPDLRIDLPVVFPGRYRVALQYEPSEEESAAGRKSESFDASTIDVTAGKETVLRLGLPAGDG